MLTQLTQIPLFQGLPPDGLSRLAEQGHQRVFAHGTPLIRQGDIGDSLHIILKGRVRVELVHPQLIEPVVLADLGPGEVVGELGLLDGEPRSATATAVGEVDTFEVEAPTLAQTVHDYPETAGTLRRVLSPHLRTVDELIEHLAAKDPTRSHPNSP